MKRSFYNGLLMVWFILTGFLHAGIPAEVRVLEVLPDAESLRVEIVEVEPRYYYPEEEVVFQVGKGDLEIGYAGRVVRGDIVGYGEKVPRLENIFPLTGEGSNRAKAVNQRLLDSVTSAGQKPLETGDRLPEFVLVDQNGRFFSLASLRGKAFTVGFFRNIRGLDPSSFPVFSRTLELREAARRAGGPEVAHVLISLDPGSDSPGALKTFAQQKKGEMEDFHLLTGTEAVVNAIRRWFGMGQDGDELLSAIWGVDAEGVIRSRQKDSDGLPGEMRQTGETAE